MAAELVVRILGDSSSLRKELDRSTKSTKKFGRDVESAGRGAVAATIGFRGLGRAVGYASASFLGAAGFVTAVKAGFDEMAAGQAVAADTAAVLKSTGRVAGVTAGQVDRLAGSLQRMSGYDDEAVASAENLLLTFTNVRDVAGKGNDVFTQTIKSTLDLSRRFKQDLSTSAVQLGKALQDPVRGVTALRRAGISFTANQQRLINRLVATGRLLDAQKIILAEVRKETGGAAKAYGQTLPGQLDILKGNLTNLAGEIAKTLNPEIKKLTTRFNEWLENPENKKKIIDDVTASVHGLGVAFGYAADAAKTAKSIWDAIPDTLTHKGLIEILSGAGAPGPLQKVLDLFRGGGGGAAAGGLQGPVGTLINAARPPGLQGLIRPPRAGAKPPGTTPPPRVPVGATTAQRNAWFDAMIGRELVDVQDIGTLKGQIARLKEVSAQITARIAVTKDITRKLTLEAQVKAIARDIRGDQTQISQNREAARQAAADRKAAAQQAVLDRLQLSVDKTGLTDTLSDDLAALKNQQRVLKGIIRTQGSTLALQQTLLGVEQNIKTTQGQIDEARKQDAAAAQQRRLDQLQLSVDRTALTSSLQDDLKPLQAYERALKGIIRTQGSTLALQQQLLGVELAINSKQAEIDAAATKRRKAAAARAVTARNARQFRAIGLTATGEQPTPGVEALQTRLANLRKRLVGTGLDRGKLHGQLAGAAKDLVEGAGQPIRAAIDQLFDSVDAKLDERSKGTLTRFKRLSAANIAKSLGPGLSGSQLRRLEAGIATIGPGLTRAQGTPAFGAGRHTVVINGPMHFHGVQDVQGLENELVKRTKARGHTRRGTR